MKPRNHTDAQRIVGRIEAGTASRSDVVALLIYLREHLDDRDPVKDIAHCIAHSDRTRGIAFTYIATFVDEFIDGTQRGGQFTVTVLFPLADVMEQLVADLQRQGLTVQPEAFRQQASLLLTHLRDILDGVTLKLPNAHVVDCQFATSDSYPHPSFRVRFRGLEQAKALQIPANVYMAFPVLIG